MPKTATDTKTTKKPAKKAEKKTPAKKSSTKKTPAKKSAPKKTKKVEKNSDEFAVILTGGKQYVVSVGDTLSVEKLDTEEGKKVVFDKVLLVEKGSDTTIGTPYIDGAKVEAFCEVQGKAKKVDVVKYKSKSRYFKRRGHRQPFTKVIITEIK